MTVLLFATHFLFSQDLSKVKEIQCAKVMYITDDSNVVLGDYALVYVQDTDAEINLLIYETTDGYMFKTENLYGGQYVTFDYCVDKFSKEKIRIANYINLK